LARRDTRRDPMTSRGRHLVGRCKCRRPIKPRGVH
jgi:hypothetical protein